MKTLIIIPLVLAVAVSGAQTTKQNQIPHVETSLNHLTVLEFGEPVTTLAVADPDSFRVERHDDKVFVEPLRESVATNLFIWTASRQLSYELDPAGPLTTMDVLIRTEPAIDPHRTPQTAAEASDADIRKIASLVLVQAMMGVEDIAHNREKPAAGQIQIELEQAYRTKNRLYIRYSVTNQTNAPFRLTTPDVSTLVPTQIPFSLLGLRNHQISSETFSAFKAKAGPSLTVIQAEAAGRDLAPGQKTTGVVSIGCSQDNPPQLYQLNFGADRSKPLTVDAVL